ncbi:MAG: PrsW family glutamic-type intramembrane protease [bacterium]
MANYLINQLQGAPLFAIEVFAYALVGGVLPAMFWLWFWMHEANDHKEPKDIIFLSFVVGMCGVFVVYPLQKISVGLFNLKDSDLHAIYIWALIEEAVKFGGAWFIALRSKTIFNHPIDSFIYLMSVSLGFAAMENTLFLLTPLFRGDLVASIMTGAARFMGASLLHVAASGVFSIFIGYGFYRGKFGKFSLAFLGLLVAGVIHTIFNYIIVISDEQNMFIAFSFVWISIILLILSLEKVKQIKQF